MPITVTWLDGGRGILHTAHGVITGADVIPVMQSVNSRDLKTHPILYSFVDGGGVTHSDMSESEIRRLAAMTVETARKQAGTKRVFCLYVRDDVTFGLARIFQSLAELGTDWESMIFRERSKAIAWTRERVASLFGFRITLE